MTLHHVKEKQNRIRGERPCGAHPGFTHGLEASVSTSLTYNT